MSCPIPFRWSTIRRFEARRRVGHRLPGATYALSRVPSALSSTRKLKFPRADDRGVSSKGRSDEATIRVPTPTGRRRSRRDFLRLAVAAGGVLSLTWIVPLGQYLIGPRPKRERIVFLDGSLPHLGTFPPNSGQSFSYPRTGDPAVDTEPFRQFVLVRLPRELGGAAADLSAFRAYSRVCVFEWTLLNYVSHEKQLHDPNCGSVFRVTDGKALRGPATLMPPPRNTLPQLSLDVEGDGVIVVQPPVWDAGANGIIGFGRSVQNGA